MNFSYKIQVNDAMDLSRLILALQWERAAVSLSVFLDAKTGTTTDLSVQYANTDRAIRMVEWRPYGPEKVFENPLRFQIRIDDFRLEKKSSSINLKNSFTIKLPLHLNDTMILI